LEELIANRRVLAAEINARRQEGDLAENSGYHAAREEQGQQEARIRQLQDLVRNARIGEAPETEGVAEPGMVLTVRYSDEPEPETFLLAAREQDTPEGMEVYSPQSPLGHALLGATEGETRGYDLPHGGRMEVTLIKAQPYSG
jgi:transcription elongation factor GreA